MPPRAVVVTQVVFNLVSYTLALRWFLWPRLTARPRHEALIPLVMVHWIRTLGLFAMVPALAGPAVAATRWAHDVVVGDALTVVLAWISVALLRRRAAGALAAVWITNVVGSLDVLNAGFNAARERILDLGIGPHLVVVTFAVPALVVSHVAIFRLLLRREPDPVAIRSR